MAGRSQALPRPLQRLVIRRRREGALRFSRSAAGVLQTLRSASRDREAPPEGHRAEGRATAPTEGGTHHGGGETALERQPANSVAPLPEPQMAAFGLRGARRTGWSGLRRTRSERRPSRAQCRASSASAIRETRRRMAHPGERVVPRTFERLGGRQAKRSLGQSDAWPHRSQHPAFVR